MDLDNMDFQQFDKSGMIKQIKSFTQDFKDAWRQTDSIVLPESYNQIKNIVLLGMGGSGASNELIKELAFQSCPPVECVHDYTLPGFVNEDTLVIASSYSGNTEETIRCFKDAKALGAKLFAITTGGVVKQLAEEYKCPSFFFDYPSQPRMATPYLLSPLIRIFNLLGFYSLPDNFEQICDNAETTIKDFYPETLVAQNLAKELAQDLYKKFPIFYASPNFIGLAMRFKNQINENAKKTAAYDYFPELNHNTIEAYPNPDCDLVVVLLESKFTSDRIKLREDITTDILERSGINYKRIIFNGLTNALSEHLVMMSFSDAVSYYLTILNQTDPTSIPNIKYLKSKL